jgi:hypothetical protein
VSDRPSWIVVETFAQVYEAEIAKAILESSGIPAQVMGEHVGVFGPGWAGMAIRGVRLMVPAAALEDAREVLSEDAYFEHDPDDEEVLDEEGDEDGDEEEESAEDRGWQGWGEWGPGAA